MSEVLRRTEAALCAAFGEPDARASVTFLGTERIEVLRFLDSEPVDPGADGSPPQGGQLVRYATLGMSAAAMTDPTAALADPERGPRAELLLSVRVGLAETDKALRPLAVLAASPQVEGVVVTPGAALELGEPLWPGAPFTSVLVGDSGGLIEDLELEPPREPVRFLSLVPVTSNEAAWKRVHGAEALRERWLRHGTDLRDPLRAAVPLTD